jgi:hypothetical protein
MGVGDNFNFRYVNLKPTTTFSAPAENVVV